MSNKSLNAKIREARKGMGLTQIELAKRLGVTFQHLSLWERGIVSPSYRNLVKIANVCKVSLDWLLADRGPAKPKTLKVAEAPSKYKGIEFSLQDLKLLQELNKRPKLKRVVKTMVSADKKTEAKAKELALSMRIPFEAALIVAVRRGKKGKRGKGRSKSKGS